MHRPAPVIGTARQVEGSPWLLPGVDDDPTPASTPDPAPEPSQVDPLPVEPTGPTTDGATP